MADEEVKKLKVQANKEIGQSGTVLLRGILSNTDYNRDLTGTQRIDIYDKMRLGDATVRAALMSVKLPIQSTEWYIKPPKGKDEEDEITKFVKKQILENNMFSFASLLRNILTFCEYGNAIFEKVYYITPEGKIGLKKLAQRLSKTIQRWEMQTTHEEGITQLVPQAVDGKTLIEIPKWKLAMFILDQEGDNYEGISLLRSAYKHWLIKDTYYKIDSIATERQGLGVPIIKSPPQANPADKEKARRLARNLRANEDAYMDLPVGFSIEFLDMKSSGNKNPEKMIGHHDRQIVKSVLAEFLELGATQSGSYSVSDTQVDFFYLGEQYLARLIRDGLQAEIKNLVDLNFLVKDGEYPTLEFGQIGKLDFDKLATALSSMITSGVIYTDDQLERHVRNAMNLPEADHLEKGEKIERFRPGMFQKEGLDDEKGKGKDKDDDKKKEGLDKKKKKEVKAHDESVIDDLVELKTKIDNTIYAKETKLRKSKPQKSILTP